MERILIVNADDFGFSENVNRGILRAHREGILTSASLMVHMPAAKQAIEMTDGLDLGLHVDLAEWAYRNGQWLPLYERVPVDDPAAVRGELGTQLEAFRRLTGRNPTHLDSHQHVHLHEPVRSILFEIALELAVPLRGVSKHVRYCGDFYGQSGKGAPCPERICVEAMIRILRGLPAGITEVACHPGADGPLDSDYSHERSLEADVLCDHRVRQIIAEEDIQLLSFADVANSRVSVNS
jgi:predicted glycoside hydrolase/deacetylase ChbG (UPF0249 family)